MPQFNQPPPRNQPRHDAFFYAVFGSQFFFNSQKATMRDACCHTSLEAINFAIHITSEFPLDLFWVKYEPRIFSAALRPQRTRKTEVHHHMGSFKQFLAERILL